MLLARVDHAGLLPKGHLAGPMPWVIAIMMFLTVLAAAAALSLGNATRALGSALEGELTVQIAEPDSETRDAITRSIADMLRRRPDVAAISIVPQADLEAQLSPWLGDDLGAADIPIPALIDVTLTGGADVARATAAIADAIRPVSARARVDGHARYLGPLRQFIGTIGWLSFGMVALMALATGAVVVLAARGAQAVHRGTIDIMHLMGATDVQIARIFQRRIALDAAFGCLLGFAMATLVILLLGQQIAALASGLIATVALPIWGWAVLALLPVAGVAIAFFTARHTVLRTLGQTL